MVAGGDSPHARWSTTTTICYLGELSDSAQARWQKTIEAFNEQGESTQLKLFPNDGELPEDPNVARVLVKKGHVERTRRFGDCYLGLELGKRLGLQEFFDQALRTIETWRCAPGAKDGQPVPTAVTLEINFRMY